MRTFRIRKVDQNLLNEIRDVIVSHINPKKIILFGSYAYGKPKKDSDLDLLVVVDQIQGRRRDIRLKIRRLLRKYLISKDIIVVTPEDIDKWKDIPSLFLTSVVKRGKVLYERKD